MIRRAFVGIFVAVARNGVLPQDPTTTQRAQRRHRTQRRRCLIFVVRRVFVGIFVAVARNEVPQRHNEARDTLIFVVRRVFVGIFVAVARNEVPQGDPTTTRRPQRKYSTEVGIL